MSDAESRIEALQAEIDDLRATNRKAYLAIDAMMNTMFALNNALAATTNAPVEDDGEIADTTRKLAAAMNELYDMVWSDDEPDNQA